jgi:hypothetical protein
MALENETINEYPLTGEFITKILGEIESYENQDRKRSAFQSHEIYGGLLHKYVQARLSQMYPKTYKQYSVADYSLLKKVVDKKAKSYKDKPIRKIVGFDNDTVEYEALAKRSHLNKHMKVVDRYFNQFKYCALAIFPDEIKNVGITKEVELKFIPLAPYEYDVVKDEDGCPKVFILSYPNFTVTRSVPSGDGVNQTIAQPTNEDNDVRSYVFWTDFEHKLIKVKGSGDKMTIWEEAIPNNPDGINPYGCLPIIEIPKGYDSNYPLQSPLPRQTVELNALLSIYLQSGSMQVGQLIFEYPQDQEIEVVHQGIFSGLKLPQSKNPDDAKTDARYISPNPNLSGHRESIFTFLNLIIDEQGLGTSANVSTKGDAGQSFTSALDRMLANADIQSIIEDNQEMYSHLEHEIFEVVREIYKYYDAYKFNEEADVSVTYVKPKMLISDGEQLDNLQKMKNLGIFADYQILQAYNPNLSEEEAIEEMAEIRADKYGILPPMNDLETTVEDNNISNTVDVNSGVMEE